MPPSAGEGPPPTAPRYRGRLDVRVERDGRLLRLNEAGALPLRALDRFRIEAESPVWSASRKQKLRLEKGHRTLKRTSARRRQPKQSIAAFDGEPRGAHRSWRPELVGTAYFGRTIASISISMSSPTID